MATLEDLLVRIGIDTEKIDRDTKTIQGKFSSAFKSIKAGSKTLTSVWASAGQVAPAAAAGAGAVLSLGSALAGAGAAAGVFGAVLKQSVTEVKEHATKVEDLNDKMDLYGKQAEIMKARGEDNAKMLKKQAAAQLELEARLKNLPPATRDATMGFLQMKEDWGNFVEQNQPATFGLMAKGYGLIGSSIQKLQPLFDVGVLAANRLFDSLEGAVKGGMLERLADRAGPAMESLTGIIINTATAITNMFGKVGDAQGQGILVWLDGLTARWADWASATEQGTGIQKFIEYIDTNGPQLTQTLGDIAAAATNIATAVTPLAPLSLAVASALAAIIAAVPPDVITALVAGFIAYGAALKVWAVYQAIATAAQWAHNAAMLASPTTWIILAIVALIAVIVLIATKTKWFQNIWAAVWGFLKMVGAWFAGPFAGFFVMVWNKILYGLGRAKQGFFDALNFIKMLAMTWLNVYRVVITKIIDFFTSLVTKIRSGVGRIKSALSGMWDGMKSGFRTAVNWVIGKWNGLRFTIPSFSILGKSFGGGSIGVPSIPYLADGGIVTGPTLAMIGEGGEDEAVVPLSKLPELDGRDDRPIVLAIDGNETDFRRWLKKSIRVKGTTLEVV